MVVGQPGAPTSGPYRAPSWEYDCKGGRFLKEGQEAGSSSHGGAKDDIEGCEWDA
jgi:hypothetical protein